MLADDFADGDDLLLPPGVIEKEFFALFHFFQIAPRREIAHAAPCLALGAARDLIVPGEFLRLGLHQPIRHDYSSALNGRDSNDSIAASTLSLSVRSASTAVEIGISTPRSLAISTSTAAVKMPSARPP